MTATAIDVGATHETQTDTSGRYAFPLVAPGSYEIRGEALGYRPVLARTLVLSGGETGNVALTMQTERPPVLSVDTVTLAGSSSSRWESGGVRLGSRDLEDLPHRYGDLTSVADLSSAFDAASGAEGLPGSESLVIADGVPVYRAPHPFAGAELLSNGAFPLSALSSVIAYENPPDIEWGASAGGYLALTTRSGTRDGAPEVEGGWSGDPLWSSSQLDVAKPSMMSFLGGARTTMTISPGVSQLVVSADGMHEETPLAARVSEDQASALTGLDPDLVGMLTAPSVERFERFSGLARFDQQRASTGRLFVRGAVGYSKRDFEGPGPTTLARAAALPEQSIDYSVAAGMTTQSSPGLVFEIRAGVSGSARTFDPAHTGMPTAVLADPGSSLGVLPWGGAESSRTDIVLIPAIRYGVAGGSLKLGASIRATSNAMSPGVDSRFYFSDGGALVAGQGLVQESQASKVSFSTKELGAFAQYDVEPRPGFRASLGGRLDYELIPGSKASFNSDWAQASGLRNDSYPSHFGQASALASISWDPSLDGSTELFGTVSVREGDLDPTVLARFFQEDVGATSTSYAGPGLNWPIGTIPSSATTLPELTLLGPDTRAPRSLRATAGIVRKLAGAWRLHLGGAYRRTDFLMRRRNLNLPDTPIGMDPYGRNVWSTVVQDGSLVTATGSDSHRFPGFASVWALDPDGWSKYLGGTAGLEYESESAGLYVSYTRSETTDNWIGAAAASPDAELSPLLPAGSTWSEGTSDFDAPDRISAVASVKLSLASVSATYHYRSGLPFTPGYRPGVDANGDGSVVNDVAYVDGAMVDPLLSDWPCLSDQVGGFARRNSCRTPATHELDVRLRLDVGRLMGRDASLVLDAFNLIEPKSGVVDGALLLVDPAGTLTTAPDGTVTVPVTINPNFGHILYPSTRGRMIRVGFRIG